MTAPLLTVGHGALSQQDLGALLTGAGVEVLVDVRRFPGSRAHPHVTADALAAWLPPLGVDDRSEPRRWGVQRAVGGAAAGADGRVVVPWWTPWSTSCRAGGPPAPAPAEFARPAGRRTVLALTP